jgi:hypothetical protein
MATTTIQAFVRPLTTNEQAGNSGFTHEAVFGPGTSNPLNDSVADEDIIFNLFKFAPGDVMVKAALIADPAFKNTADAAFNSTAFSFGDEDLGTRFISGVELNENGTEVLYTYDNTAYGPYTAVKQATVLVESMAAKKLINLNVGRAILLIQVMRLTTLAKAVTGGGI